MISSSHCAVEVGHPPAGGHARLLLPLADALCVGPVRRLLRPGTGRTRSKPAAAARPGRLARWDAATADRVDRFLANSQYVAGRIRRYYNRGSTVVYPPVDTTFYRLPTPRGATSNPAFSWCLPWFLTSVSTRDRGLPEGAGAAEIVGRRARRGPASPACRTGRRVPRAGERRGDSRPLPGATAVLLPGRRRLRDGPGGSAGLRHAGRRPRPGGRRETVDDGVTGILVDEHSVDGFADGAGPRAGDAVRSGPDRRHAERFSRERFLADFQMAVDAADRGRSITR